MEGIAAQTRPLVNKLFLSGGLSVENVAAAIAFSLAYDFDPFAPPPVSFGLALIVALYRKRQTAHVEDLTSLRL